MNHRELRCYGTFRTTDKKCLVCRYRGWCRTAVNPPLQASPGYETMIATTPAVEPLPDATQDDMHTAAFMARYALLKIHEAANANPVRLAIMVARYGGLSYAEIAALHGMTKQAVHQHLLDVAEVHPELAELLCIRPLTEESLTGSLDMIQQARKWHETLREATKWQNRMN